MRGSLYYLWYNIDIDHFLRKDWINLSKFWKNIEIFERFFTLITIFQKENMTDSWLFQEIHVIWLEKCFHITRFCTDKCIFFEYFPCIDALRYYEWKLTEKWNTRIRYTRSRYPSASDIWVPREEEHFRYIFVSEYFPCRIKFFRIYTGAQLIPIRDVDPWWPDVEKHRDNYSESTTSTDMVSIVFQDKSECTHKQYPFTYEYDTCPFLWLTISIPIWQYSRKSSSNDISKLIRNSYCKNKWKNNESNKKIELARFTHLFECISTKNDKRQYEESCHIPIRWHETHMCKMVIILLSPKSIQKQIRKKYIERRYCLGRKCKEIISSKIRNTISKYWHIYECDYDPVQIQENDRENHTSDIAQFQLRSKK